ncbi:MAG TPA: AAA family ATPase, partial [Candidatus Cybelea sp.]|nr:AAA family ATPase [Candidatus Cybelea sp.]
MALHIDYEIRWKNFRAFEDTGWIVIRPLTILIGPNNSGKSSILAPLLLMSQTMSSRDSITPLVTRGPLIDVGIFKDFIHKHDTSRSLYLGFRYHVHEPHDYKGKIEGIGSYPPGALEVTFTVGKRPEDLILSRFELSDIFKRPFLTQWRDPGGKYRVGGQYFRQKKSNRLKRAEREVIRTTSPVNFLFSPAALINA